MALVGAALLFEHLDGSGERFCVGAFAASHAVQFVEGPLKVVAVDGFEQIVDAVDLEGLKGILVVGGGEDDGTFGGDLVEDAEGQTIGQVYVHEDYLGVGVLRKPFHRFFHTLQYGHDAEVGSHYVELPSQIEHGY